MNEVDKAQRAARKAVRKLRKAQIAAARAEALAIEKATPLEPSGGLHVITFTKTFGGSTTYTYAAIRPRKGSMWYLSGIRAGTPMSWNKLLEFVTRREPDVIKAYRNIRDTYILDTPLLVKGDFDA